jgi:hypothetical protein
MDQLVRYVHPWPESSQLLSHYDEEVIFKYYNIEDLYSGQKFFYRQFVKNLCLNLNNERAQKVMKALDLKPRFESTEKNGILCYFVLPYEKEVRKTSLTFLFDSIFIENTSKYIEEVLCNQKYFIMVAQQIT